MSNLKTVSVAPSTEYQNLATLAGITFVSGTTYSIQVEGDVMVCESATKPTEPTERGTHVFWPQPFIFDAGSDPLWVKNLREFENAIINISD